MTKLTEASQRTPQHVAVMGDPGSGKSTLAALLAAEGMKLLWFSLDGGHSVLFKLPKEAQERVELIRIPDTRAWPIAWTTINKLFDCKKLKICELHGADACSTCSKDTNAKWTDVDVPAIDLETVVVIDHGSQLADSCMNTVTKSKPVDYKLQLDDWGDMRFHLAAFGKKIQAAPFHVVMLFQPEESKMEDGRIKLTPGWGSNNSSKTSSQYFDHLVYCEVYNKSHKAGSSSTYSVNAVSKSRTDIEIEKLEKPSLLPFFSVSGQKAAVIEDKKVAATVLGGIASEVVLLKGPLDQTRVEALKKELMQVEAIPEAKPPETKLTIPTSTSTHPAVAGTKSALEKLREMQAKNGKK